MISSEPNTFAKSVESTCGDQLRASGFASTYALFPCDERAVFLKGCKEQVSLYLFFTDNRRTGGNVTVTLWLAPVQLPDDRIAVLGIGICLLVFSGFQIDDEVIVSATSKAIAMSDILQVHQQFVAQELQSPYLINSRVATYKSALDLYEQVSASSEFSIGIAEIADEFIARKISLECARERCKSILNNLSSLNAKAILDLSERQIPRLLTEIAIARRLANLTTRTIKGPELLDGFGPASS